jgi:hypothetical protein
MPPHAHRVMIAPLNSVRSGPGLASLKQGMDRRKPIILALTLAGVVVAAVATGAIGLPPSSAPACPVLPADNPWNQRVDGVPALSESATLTKHLGSNASVFADFSIPYVTVPGSQRRVPVRFHYWRESDRGTYPIPRNPPVERGTPDRHLLVLDRDNCRLYELYKARRIKGRKAWRAGSGAIWNLRSNRLRPKGWTSADAAGLPILPGLARFDEIQRGVIDHALRFTAEGIRDTYVYPARHSDGRSSGREAPPMGARFRLRASFDTSTFPPQSRVILEALKRYGMILADSGPAFSLGGAPAAGWNGEDLDSLRRVKGRDLEAVDTSALPKPGA